MTMFFGVVLVLAAIGIVAWPLLRGAGQRGGPPLVVDSEVDELLAQKDATLFAINELESDYEMGNMSQRDYKELREKYEEKAVTLIKTADGLRAERGLDLRRDMERNIEARVSSLRSAKGAGLRIETETETGTGTGTEIGTGRTWAGSGGVVARPSGACPRCGAKAAAEDAYCSSCGAELNARCPYCAAPAGADDRFCSKCGASLAGGASQ